MRTALLITAAALTLSGCGSAASGGNSASSSTTTTSSSTTAGGATTNTTSSTTTTTASASSGLPTAASLGIKPGKWENTVQILDMDMKIPGMTPEMSARMKQMAASRGPEKVVSCLSPEEAAKGPSTAMLDKAHCSFTKSDTAGGRISTEMVCNMPNGTLKSTGEGSYTPTSYDVDGHGSMTGRMSMTMHTRTSGKWLGQCDGTEVNAKGRNK